MKQVDSRTSMHSKIFDAVHGRHNAYQQCHLFFIDVIHIRSVL